MLKMKTHRIIAILSLTVIYTVNAIPQRVRTRQSSNNNDPNVQDSIQDSIISEIFASSPRPSSQSDRGAGFIVTPDPTFTPTSSPLMLNINEQNCTCVPYHMCDPNTNTVKNPNADDEVIGFGVIDIRFDPLDCQDVLDVCCVGAATREEPIIPKEKPDVPTQEAGCGVRNVGGLDFEVAGAFVSTNLC